MTVIRWIVILVCVGYAWRRKSLTTWILAAMVVGAEVGNDWPGVAVNLRLLSLIFLNLIRTIIAPLLFATLVVGIAGHASLRQVGRMGLKALVYFEIVTTLALLIGVVAINFSKAGVGVTLPAAPAAPQITAPAPQSASDIILHIFPENIAKSIAEGQVLQIVLFSILFGIALGLVKESKRQPVLSFCESLSETMFKFTNIIMMFAPIGVGAAIAYTVGHMGLGILVNLFKLLATLYAALFVFVGCVLLPIALMARVPIREFVKAIAEPVWVSFATPSKAAALARRTHHMQRIDATKASRASFLSVPYTIR